MVSQFTLHVRQYSAGGSVPAATVSKTFYIKGKVLNTDN